MKESFLNVLSSLFVIELIISTVTVYRLHMESKSKHTILNIHKLTVHKHHQDNFPVQNFSFKKGKSVSAPTKIKNWVMQ